CGVRTYVPSAPRVTVLAGPPAASSSVTLPPGPASTVVLWTPAPVLVWSVGAGGAGLVTVGVYTAVPVCSEGSLTWNTTPSAVPEYPGVGANVMMFVAGSSV